MASVRSVRDRRCSEIGDRLPVVGLSAWTIVGPRARFGVGRALSARAVITIVARNYVSRARVLGASLRRTNPELSLTALVVDGEGALPTPGDDGVRWVDPSDLPLASDEFARMATIYEIGRAHV